MKKMNTPSFRAGLQASDPGGAPAATPAEGAEGAAGPALPKQPKRFSGLDGLRFVSITFVILHHLFTFKTNFGYHAFDYPVLGTVGLYGIHFFFMGSGFLITYLLLRERQQTGTVNLKDFYMRRILRIWPAYYLLLLLALVVALRAPFFRIPGVTEEYLSGNYGKTNALFAFFLPHLTPFHGSTPPYVHHTYTIGIEEQFYLAWGLLFSFFYRRIYWFFMALLVGMPLLSVLHQQLFLYTTSHPGAPLPLLYVQKGITYLQYSRVSTFAIGSLFGYAYFFQKGWIFVFRNKWVQAALYVLFAASILFRWEVPFAQQEYMAAIMGCIMLAATFRRESIFNYSAPWMEYLGKISYGIYLFHMFAIVLAVKLLGQFFGLPMNTFGQVVLLCGVTLAISILFGWLSYHYFESYFLKLKKRFQKV